MIHENIRQKFEKQRPNAELPMPEIQAWILEQLARYFIIIVSSFLLFIALNGQVVGYKIIYMLFFLFSGVIFQLSWNMWHRVLRVFWLLLVVYSILVVVLIYTFQLNGFQDYWKNITTLNTSDLEDIGLKYYEDSSGLMMSIFLPTAFLVCCMLQLHYYHERFIVLTDEHTDDRLQNGPLLSRTRFSRRRSDSFLTKNTKWRELYAKFSVFAEIFKRIMWKLLEIHRWKICAIVVILSALSQPSACYLFPALLWILGLPFRNLDLFVYILTLVWSSLMLLFNMIYQLEFVHQNLNQTLLESTRCDDEDLSVDLMKWIGFEKVDDQGSFCEFVRGWLSIIIVLLAERVIFRRSRFLENHYPEMKVAPGAVFPEIIRENADRSVKECCKFFANYFFHKFGVEVCFISSVITIWTRKDFFGTIYAIWLLILLVLSSNSRRTLAKVWKGYTIFLSVLWAVEFVLVLNIPKALCVDLKEKYYNNPEMIFVQLISDENERLKFVKYLFLPLEAKIDEVKASVIILDFFQLLLAVCQCGVFENENTDTWIKLAGRNDDTVLDDVKDNPHRNFILAEPPTTLDRLKTFVFSMVYWVTFTVVLIAGTNRTSLFCLGYLVASFYFLYQGQMIITCRPSILRRRWNWLLFYNGIVVVTKCCLQLLACVFSGTVDTIDGDTCYLRSLLSLSCEDISYFDDFNKKPPPNDCIHEKDVQAVGIAWDFATFVFLLLQRRIFQSYYFLHVREDLIVQIGLSSKGNQLFSMWVQMEAGKRKKNEEIDKERVQESVERIRRNVRSDLQEPYDHFDALRVCDKTWFEGLTETIDDDNDAQTPHGLPQSASDSGIKSTPGMQHSITDNQLSAAGNSPKLPQSFRDIKQGIGNVLFTGRLPGKDMSESKDTLFERPQQTDKEQSPKLPTAGRPRVDWADEHADRVFKSVSYDKSDHIVPMEEDSTMSEPGTSPGEASKSPELTVAIPKEDSEPQGNLLYDTVIYFTRVLNTRTQAYRSIIIQLKRDRQESRNTLPVVADRRYAHQIRNAALNRVARHGTGSNAGSQTGTDVETPSSASRTHQDDFANYFVSPDDFDKEDHFIQRLLSAIWYFAQFQIDNLCYALMILNGMLNASILSIPMLGMVFLWAMLSVPRPSKRFWVTVIGYTCLVITIKYIFAFKFWIFYKDASSTEDPFTIQKIFGVENRDGVKYLDIAQLLVLFFQRGLLKVHGLWENYDERDLDDDDDNTNLFQVYIVDKTIDGFDRLVGRNKSKECPKKRKDKNQRSRNSEQNKNCFSRVIDWVLNKLLVFFKSPGRFYARLIQQEKEKKNMPTDMYIWMLGCDFICFIIIMFGYWAFGKHTVGQSLDITVQIKENTVPKSFLYLLITHFFLILIDRAIYLKKNLMAKLIFHFAQVLVIHIWIFFLLPQITSRSFFKNNVAISLYTFKAIYFAFSAHQIKSGYPTRILQHFLTKRYNYVNLYVFIGYRVCPFIIEFQNIMDWMFVESTVGISRWFMLTTIYHELYQIKCWRHLEKQFHYPRGFPRWPSFKYSGEHAMTRFEWIMEAIRRGLLIILLIIIMWFPLAFMSIVQTVAGIPNAPKEVKISLSLEGFSDIFTDYSVSSNLIPFTEIQFNDLNRGFSENLGAQQMLSRYDHGDLFFVKVNKNSDTIWSITEPQKMNMIRLLEKRVIRENTTTCGAWFIFDYRIRRNPNQYEKLWEYASGEAKHELSEKECADFKAVLEGERPDLSVTIHKAIPHYIRALNTDTAREMTSILNVDLNTKLWANVTLNLERRVTVLRVCETATGAYKINATESCNAGETEHVTVKEEKWWKMTTLGKLIPTDPESDDLVDKLIIISDKTGPESLAWLTGYGVIGLYLSVVLLAGRYTRAIFQYDGAYIMFHEYPNVDELLQLCSDIYLVRELKEWKLEEDLMAKLIYLYRSPETMLKVTKLRPYKPRVKQIKQD